MTIDALTYQHQIKDITNLSHLNDFVKTCFVQYHDRFTETLGIESRKVRRGERVEDPEYLQLAARVLMMAAEYGFESCMGYVYRHDKLHFGRSFSDPVHFLGIAGYMSDVTLQAEIQKQQLIDEFNRRNGPDINRDKEIRMLVIEPSGGKVKLPTVEEYRMLVARKKLLDRRSLSLEIIEPDLIFHRNIHNIGFNSHIADRITQEEFNANYLNKAQQSFTGVVDIARVFSNHERWYIPS